MQKKPDSRIDLLDALRGVALLGILLAHMSHWFAAGPLPVTNHTAITLAPKEFSFGIPEFLSAAFVNGKFYPLFTFIFGFSFFLQARSFGQSSQNTSLLFLRRALCLFFIGFIHQLFWMGDILMLYGILMIPMIFLRKLSDRSLLVIGLLFVFNVFGTLLELGQVAMHSRKVLEENTQANIFLHVISKGNLKEIIAFNFMNLPGKLKFQAISGRLFITLGFFLLGMLTARKGWLQQLAWLKGKLYLIFISCFVLMVVLQLITNNLNYTEMSDSKLQIIVSNALLSIQSFSSIMLYISFVAILYHLRNKLPLFSLLAPIGRTALSMYIMQTVIGFLLFFHPGFGLFGQTSHLFNVGLGLVIFMCQVWIAKTWLRYFNYGLLEWILRATTFGEFHQLRRS